MVFYTINASTRDFSRHNGVVRNEECLRGAGISKRKIKVVAKLSIVLALPVIAQRPLPSLGQCTAGEYPTQNW